MASAWSRRASVGFQLLVSTLAAVAAAVAGLELLGLPLPLSVPIAVAFAVLQRIESTHHKGSRSAVPAGKEADY